MAQSFTERSLPVLRPDIGLKGRDTKRDYFPLHCRLQTVYWKNAFSKRFEISTYTFYLLLHLAFHMLCWLPKQIAASFSSAVLLSLLFPGAIAGNLQLCSISSFETASPYLQLTIKLSWLSNEEISLLGYLQNQPRTRWNLCCVRCSLSAQQQFSSHSEQNTV